MHKKSTVTGLGLKVRNGRTYLRGVNLQKYDTPFFIYDWQCIAQKIRAVREGLSDDIKLYYAIKANPNLGLLKRMLPLVDGVDVASGGELTRALKAGCCPSRISFAGPGKTEEELSLAVSRRIGSLSVESLTELVRIDRIAAAQKRKAAVSIRINPARPQRKFPVKMGGLASPFGIDQEKWGGFFRLLEGMRRCRFVGIHVYSGTQCLDEATLLDNAVSTLNIAEEVYAATRLEIRSVNFGGGFGVPYYEGQSEIDVRRVCSGISSQFGRFKRKTGLSGCTGILELGRYLVAQAGIYVARIVDVKESRGKKFCVLDGGINHHLAASGRLGNFIRRNLRVVNISCTGRIAAERVTLVGPLCASLDIIAEDLLLKKPQAGQYIAVLTSGAYTYTASPILFLSHETPLELLVDGARASVIRRSHAAGEFD
ncbi:MAG TPA: pyridoxal-dependent decarboxylase, exosortase A system-associated [Patescibacteria group bacterium]|nr:pyridoxal-dependent decarboxylase, exosortase A system-associated [Patescibacteria group bacterium]